MVFTDGRSNDQENLPKQAEALKEACSAVFAFGIGSKINENELRVSLTLTIPIKSYDRFLRSLSLSIHNVFIGDSFVGKTRGYDARFWFYGRFYAAFCSVTRWL